jgi:hypothetical protein
MSDSDSSEALKAVIDYLDSQDFNYTSFPEEHRVTLINEAGHERDDTNTTPCALVHRRHRRKLITHHEDLAHNAELFLFAIEYYLYFICENATISFISAGKTSRMN